MTGAGAKRHLTRQTTLVEFGETWGFDTFTGWRRDKWLALRKDMEALLVEGGELWEWETDGFRRFAGECGIAVVRAGVVVKEWPLGRS